MTWQAGSSRLKRHLQGNKGDLFSYQTECPHCKVPATRLFFKPGSEDVVAIKHMTYELDRACPAVDKSDMHELHTGQGLVFNYAALENLMHGARRALKAQEVRESHMDGRPSKASRSTSSTDLPTGVLG